MKLVARRSGLKLAISQAIAVSPRRSGRGSFSVYVPRTATRSSLSLTTFDARDRNTLLPHINLGLLSPLLIHNGFFRVFAAAPAQHKHIIPNVLRSSARLSSRRTVNPFPMDDGRPSEADLKTTLARVRTQGDLIVSRIDTRAIILIA